MTKDGEMDWQNGLTDKNNYFLIDGDKKDVADSMFLNFWWTYKKYADKELLKVSNKMAEELGINPYDLYAGVDVQSNGTATPVCWELFEKDSKTPFTSLGLYCPSWTYFSSENVDEFEAKENRLWVNEFVNPAKATKTEGKEWKGISIYSIEQSIVKNLPFTTNFSMGNGYNFFVDGEKVSVMDWNNRSLADVMPAYRWIIENEGNNKLNLSIDFSIAYYGGNSIKFNGKLEGNKTSTIKLYSVELKLEKGVDFKTSAKSNKEVNLDLVLEFEDGTVETIKADKVIGEDWTTISYNVSKFADKVVRTISYKISSSEDISNLTLNLGNKTIEKAPHDITIDLRDVKTVSEVRIAHAEAGGEGPDMNIKEYIIETSLDGENFEEAVKVTKNVLGNTIHAFKATEARYVRFTAVKPTQGSDSATRIYEIEVRGLDSKL